MKQVYSRICVLLFFVVMTKTQIIHAQALSLTITSTPVSCNGGCNGSATATPAGGTSPYTFSWSPSGATTQVVSGLCAGTYTCTVTDAVASTATATVMITQPTALSVTISSTSSACGNPNGSLTATAFGGTSPYTYLWSPVGQTTATATGLTAGAYTVTVTDANGCIQNAVGVVTNTPGPTVIISSFIPAGCNNADGSANAIATGGTPAYVYSWTPSGNTSASATSLANSVTHTVTVTDANGCTATATVTIGDSCNYVWPGDANEDAVADNNDILAIGIANGATGTTRANATTSWIGQPSTNWGQIFLSGVDYKFADCDGNGTVQPADTNAVIANFGFTHNMRIGSPVFDALLPDLTITMNQSQIGSGAPGSLSVALGSTTNPANNVYGVAFTLNFDPAQIDASSFGMNNGNCWMGTVGSDLMGVVLRPSSGGNSVQIALTRLDHNNVNGFGNIADLGFTTTTAFMGTFQNQDVIFSISNVTVISANEISQQVNAVNDTVNVCDPGVLSAADHTNYADVNIYPNPVNDLINISLSKNITAAEITLSDATGRIVLIHHIDKGNTTLDLSSLERGVYFCTIRSGKNVIGVKPVIKQ